MNTARCPRFNSCNANLCPLDPQWPRAEHRQSERVCGLMTEVVKVEGPSRVRGVLSADQYAIFAREWPKIEARWGDIRHRLKAATKTGSRIANARARFSHPLQDDQGTPAPTSLPGYDVPHSGVSLEAPSEVRA